MLGHFHEDMEVIGHDAESDDSNTAERFVFAEEGNELASLRITEHEEPFYDSRHTMIERRGVGDWRFQPW